MPRYPGPWERGKHTQGLSDEALRTAQPPCPGIPYNRALQPLLLNFRASTTCTQLPYSASPPCSTLHSETTSGPGKPRRRGAPLLPSLQPAGPRCPAAASKQPPPQRTKTCLRCSIGFTEERQSTPTPALRDAPVLPNHALPSALPPLPSALPPAYVPKQNAEPAT